MTPASDRGEQRGFPLGAKLAVLVLAATVVKLVFLLLWFGPLTTRSFLERCDVLIRGSAGAMRELARENTTASQELLIDVIGHTADSRRRVLADLPLSLYSGDVERIRGAVQRQDTARAERLQANVDVLTREMEDRWSQRIDGQVRDLVEAETALGAAFASEVRRGYVILSGSLFSALIALLGFGLWRVIILPIRDLRHATQAVARGDLSIDVGIGSRDQIGALAADFGVMVRELRRSREELRRWNETLESEVARKTAHLAKAIEELRGAQKQLIQAEKMASLGTLAGGVAHEFNNLIGGIRGCAAEALETETDGDRREPLEVIARAADRAGEITERLLRFARRRVGRMADTDVGSVLDDALRLIEPQAKRLRVEVRRDVADGLRVHGDSNALHQVFLNLLTNGLQAMPDGGELAVEARAVDDGVLVRVADTGIGIPAAELPHVFDPFFTSKDQEADPFRRGTGLGLSVSYGIVEAHGGTIEAESTVGRGTTFTITIPRIRPGAADAERSEH